MTISIVTLSLHVTCILPLAIFCLVKVLYNGEVSMPKIEASNAKKVRPIIKDFKEFTTTPKMNYTARYATA